jgi:hypothetical protein
MAIDMSKRLAKDRPSAAPPKNDDAEFSVSRPIIWLLCFVAPVIAGAIFYYSWKGTNLRAANYANRASWAVFLGYVVLSFLGLASE